MKNSIHQLLEKYFEGQTSVEEENRLKAYFQGGNVDESLKPYAPLFQYFGAEKQVALPDDFDDKLLEKIGGGAKVVSLRTRNRIWMRIAAAVVLLIGAIMFIPKIQPVEAPRKSAKIIVVEDPDEAYEVTKQALELLALKLNKGSKKAAKEVSKVEKLNAVFK
ncbi:MAG: hypothetical protein D6714_10570 [Bacteroidetes bacterium]|nr:MAG: hypothetical protein D6714_10570 [Bacteroidota bacterium]